MENNWLAKEEKEFSGKILGSSQSHQEGRSNGLKIETEDQGGKVAIPTEPPDEDPCHHPLQTWLSPLALGEQKVRPDVPA